MKAWLVTWEWGNDAAAVDGRILCGHNPWLHARIVSEFKVQSDDNTGLETISWKEPDAYKPGDEGPINTSNGPLRQIVWRIDGSLSSESIWDRAKGTFKPGWGPGESPPRRLG